MTLKLLSEMVTRARRGQAIGLLAIGMSMFAGSDLIESKVPAGPDLEFAYSLVIVFGFLAAVFVLRRPGKRPTPAIGEMEWVWLLWNDAPWGGV